MDVASTNNNREIDNGIIGGRKAYYQPDDTSTKKWTVGKISLFIIVAFSLSDLIFHLVDAQMECLEAQDHYDALSAEVIRPAFRYHRFQPPLNNGRLDAQRGFNYWKANDGSSASSSMIHSVVGQFRDTFRMSLSIIYPHNDDEYSDGNSSSNNNNINDKVSSYNQVLKIPPGGAAVAVKKSASKNNPRSSRYSTNGKEFVLSNSDCFVPLKDISQLTLKDVAMSFRYALLSTRKEYDHGKFLSGLLPRVKRVIDQMSITTSIARGKTIQAPITGGRIIPSGDIDALNFCSAMRLFAEWRVLRQVPPGYKGYAVGISLGQKDIVSVSLIFTRKRVFLWNALKHSYFISGNIPFLSLFIFFIKFRILLKLNKGYINMSIILHTEAMTRTKQEIIIRWVSTKLQVQLFGTCCDLR